MILIRRSAPPASATHPPAGSVYQPDLFLENHNRKRPPKHHPLVFLPLDIVNILFLYAKYWHCYAT